MCHDRTLGTVGQAGAAAALLRAPARDGVHGAGREPRLKLMRAIEAPRAEENVRRCRPVAKHAPPGRPREPELGAHSRLRDEKHSHAITRQTFAHAAA